LSKLGDHSLAGASCSTVACELPMFTIRS
jgi:hypothetical protein